MTAFEREEKLRADVMARLQDDIWNAVQSAASTLESGMAASDGWRFRGPDALKDMRDIAMLALKDAVKAESKKYRARYNG